MPSARLRLRQQRGVLLLFTLSRPATAADWPPFTSDVSTATCWLAVTDSTRENGCMRFLPGSHKEEQLRPHAPGAKGGDRGLGSVGLGLRVARPLKLCLQEDWEPGLKLLLRHYCSWGNAGRVPCAVHAGGRGGGGRTLRAHQAGGHHGA